MLARVNGEWKILDFNDIVALGDKVEYCLDDEKLDYYVDRDKQKRQEQKLKLMLEMLKLLYADDDAYLFEDSDFELVPNAGVKSFTGYYVKNTNGYYHPSKSGDRLPYYKCINTYHFRIAREANKYAEAILAHLT